MNHISMRAIYTLSYYLLIPFILLRFLWKSRHTVGYRKRWNERFGYVPFLVGKESLWIHAVSVGETLAAMPLIKSIIKNYSKDFRIIVTTTTPTGSALVTKHLDQSVLHLYAPLDAPTTVSRFLKRCRIKLCVIMETEMWPTLLMTCQSHNIPVVLTNARLSEKSYSGYKFIGSLTKKMMGAYHAVAAQGVLDGERFLQLGLDPKKLSVTGNIKFDLRISDELIAEGKKIRAQIGEQRRVLVAASTHETEEAIVLDAFKKIREQIPNLFLILVPRHRDRFQKVSELCLQKNYSLVLRSTQTPITEKTDILLLDSIGELQMIYAAGDIAFIGGSFVSTGGHNPVEAAALGLPVLTGPHLFNFTDISKLLQNVGAEQIVTDATTLAEAVIALCSAKELREKIGLRAKKTIDENRGALQKQLEVIAGCIAQL
ncbi:MAG: lipid IV(A) 3-deoxy-D-manno-octulosonic acid transferase [Coxiellaceae bacterium]|nr:lipid IV(A) 3-deoxy-D-manno-octulosonic acid transferase [Coxiellaceae bacterium]